MVSKIRLGELLIKEGRLTEEQLQQALARQKQTGRRLGAVLQDLGLVRDDVIARLLSHQLALPYFEPDPDQVDFVVAKRLPELQARRLRALPVGQMGDKVRVVASDPTDWRSLDELPRLLRSPVEIEVVPESGLMRLIDLIFSNNENIQGLAKQLSEELQGSTSEAGDLGVLGQQVTPDDAPVVKLLHSLFEEAVRARASDIHIEPTAQAVGVRVRVDGHLRAHAQFESRLGPALASRLKLLAALDISERRLPQDGRFVAQVRGQPVDVRMSTLPGQHGESVVMRLLVKDPMLTTLDHLGMDPAGLAALKNALEGGTGLVLVTGPTGSGKTTTLYAALGALDTEQAKVLTVEDPVEYRLPGITQVNVNERIGLGFANVLRAALRQDPDAILIGEMRDRDTVETCMRAAVTGHLVLSTLHTNDAASAALRLMVMGAPPYMVGAALQTVIAQRLVRRVCDVCAQPVQPSVQHRAWLDLQLGRDAWDPTGLRRGKGCARCRQTGYDGRVGLYEFLTMTQPMVDALLRNDVSAFSTLAQAAMAGQGLTHSAARTAAGGTTTVEEAMRIGLRTVG